MWKIIIRLLKIPETPPKAQEVSLALWDLRSIEPKTWPLLLSPFSLLSLSLLLTSLLSSLILLLTQQFTEDAAPVSYPFCKILILAFSSLPQIQLSAPLPPSASSPLKTSSSPHNKQDPSLTSTKI